MQSRFSRKSSAGQPERFHYMQQIVTEFQDTNSSEVKEQTMANLANFAYDPLNYDHIRRLNIIDLFLDHLTDTNDNILEFAIGGLCNLAPDQANQKYILDNGGIQLIIGCLSSANEETVISAITTLMFLMTPESKQEITILPVVDCMMQFASSSNRRLSNLSQVFLEDYCTTEQKMAAATKASEFLGIPLPATAVP